MDDTQFDTREETVVNATVTDFIEPDTEAMLAHLQWLVATSPYPDALVEIAYTKPNETAPTDARLFAISELDQAVKFAATMQYARRNVYVGATLKLPSSPRTQRCSGENFYCATAVPADIDEDYAATRMRLDAVCASGLIVTTGTIPEPRAQHWVRLEQPCTNADEFARAFESLVRHAGADPRAKDAARVMRLAAPSLTLINGSAIRDISAN